MGRLTDIKKRFKDGQRANRFRVLINGEGFDEDLAISVKTASTPNSTTGVVLFYNQGRQIKYPGDRVYSTFTMTVIDDIDHKYRKLFESWNDKIADPGSTVSATGDSADAVIIVQALDRDKEVVTMEWTLYGARISELGEIAYGQDSNDILAEYTVVIDYDYHEVTG